MTTTIAGQLRATIAAKKHTLANLPEDYILTKATSAAIGKQMLVAPNLLSQAPSFYSMSEAELYLALQEIEAAHKVLRELWNVRKKKVYNERRNQLNKEIEQLEEVLKHIDILSVIMPENEIRRIVSIDF